MSKIGRRSFIASAAMLPAMSLLGMGNGDRVRLYVGTYTSGGSKSKGIYLVEFDTANGSFATPVLAAATDEPSFLALSRDGEFLYAVNETLTYEGKSSGSVSAFAIDRVNGSLRFLNRQPSHGAAPCHLSISDDGRLVVVANYLGGNVAAYPVAGGGSLSPKADLKQHTGKGANHDRQEAPHAHSAILDGANKFVFVPDLGIDKVIGYSRERSGKLAAVSEFSTRPGAGPRHLKFHPNGKYAFVNNELDLTVTALSYEAASGSLKEIHTISSLPADYKFTKNDSNADLHVSPDGRVLYVSNRGHDSIARLAIDERSGRLTFLETAKTGGKTPRNFAIDPTGKFLLAANQNSDLITVFQIDKKTGQLSHTANSVAVPRPVCLVFAK